MKETNYLLTDTSPPTASAAKKVDKKVANLLLKVAQKAGTLKNQFKTVFNRFFKVKFLDFVLELVPNLY